MGKKGRMEKSRQTETSASWVFFPKIYLPTLKVYTKFKDSDSHRSQEISDRKFDWRERKMDK